MNRNRLPALATLLSTAAVLAAEPVAAREPHIVVSAGADTFAPAPVPVARNALGLPVQFDLANGQPLRLVASASGLRMRYATRAPVILGGDAQNRFASPDGRLVLQVAVDAHGQAQQVRLSMPEDWL